MLGYAFGYACRRRSQTALENRLFYRHTRVLTLDSTVELSDLLPTSSFALRVIATVTGFPRISLCLSSLF
jgi:hypothetical protein